MLLSQGGYYTFSKQKSSYLKVAKVNHAIHHLAHTEAMTKVMEGVATVILLNSKLGKYIHKHNNIPLPLMSHSYTQELEYDYYNITVKTS